MNGEMFVEELERKAIEKQQIHDKILEVLLKRKAAKVVEYVAPRENKDTSSRQIKAVTFVLAVIQTILLTEASNLCIHVSTELFFERCYLLISTETSKFWRQGRYNLTNDYVDQSDDSSNSRRRL